jgi:hypothetical protein
MNRALRALALAQLLAVGIFAAFFYAISTRSMTPEATGATRLVMALVAKTGFYLGVIAGVVTVVTCLQQQRRVWAAALVALIVLALYLTDLAYYLLPLLGVSPLLALNSIEYLYVTELVPGMLLALVVLASTLWPRPEVAGE